MDIMMKSSKEYQEQLQLEYAKFIEAHKRYDQELNELLNQRYVTEEEQMRIRDLKKLKLKMKDQMEQIRVRLESNLADNQK